ncbi:MAG: LptA/OstA family protein [Nitrospira sp.]
MGPDRCSVPTWQRLISRTPTTLSFFLLFGLFLLFTPCAWGESTGATVSPANQPLTVTAERIDHLQEREVYEADGSVVVTQGNLRLTADHVTINALPGTLTATGHVHFWDASSDLKSERLKLNVNTEGGVLANGSMFIRPSNSFFTGRSIRRLSRITTGSRKARLPIAMRRTAKCRPGDLLSRISMSTRGKASA